MMPVAEQPGYMEQLAEQQRQLETARRTAELANAEVQKLLAGLREEPHLPESEAVLRCHAKRRLFHAVKQVSSQSVASWLFESPSQMFHARPLLTPSSFANAVGVSSLVRAIRDIEETSAAHIGKPTIPKPCEQNNLPLKPGKDLLLVPVGVSGGRLIGYSFGGASSALETLRAACAFGAESSGFFPHAVGRFSYDPDMDDLLIVSHCLAKGNIGIWSVRANKGTPQTRERALFIVPGGQYGFRRKPGRILSMVQVPELRCINTISRFQFSVSNGRKPDGSYDVQGLLGKLERLVKGHFFSEKLCRDEMDEKDGQVVSRHTIKAETEFDAMDAVRLQVFKDVAVRLYYSYMAAAAAKTRGVPETNSNEEVNDNGRNMTGMQ